MTRVFISSAATFPETDEFIFKQRQRLVPTANTELFSAVDSEVYGLS